MTGMRIAGASISTSLKSLPLLEIDAIENQLIWSGLMAKFLIGVDGGGTGCRAAVADLSGTVLGEGKSGAANIVTDLHGALTNIRQAVALAFAQAGLTEQPFCQSFAFLGLAGANVAGASNQVAQLLPFAQSDVASDGIIALQGALGDQDGAVAILGTGTAYIFRQNGSIRFFGGWGFPLSDLGSGARLGRSLLQECLLVYDGIHAASPLTAAILQEFDNSPEKFVEFGRTAVPGDYGKFAPRVFEYAKRGDATAKQLLERSSDHIRQTLDMLITHGAPRISLLGGMAKYYADYLPEHQRKMLAAPAADALTGALQLAHKSFLSRSTSSMSA